MDAGDAILESLYAAEPIDLPDTLAPEYVRAHGVLPIGLDDGSVTVAAAYEADPDIADDLRVAFAVPTVRWVQAPESEVARAIERALAGRGETVTGLVRELSVVGDAGPGTELPTAEDLTSLANQAPVVKLVNLLFLEAVEARASDIHVEVHETGVSARYRIDGMLVDAPSPPAHLRDAIVSRLKVMANLDIAERRVPQDGRIRLRLKDREIDVRVSTLPAIHGESVVLRLLDPSTRRLSLEELGMEREVLSAFDVLIRRPHGIILVSGPTGSGKTTTLYAALDRIKTGREKVVTVEDPVEYRIPGVTQVQVNRAAGVTFATALRSILRQDPDIILVGEMRDPETADIAVHAALTGHLVLSTVHTNDAATGVTRLLDLGVADYLVASTVEGILAQRLIRCICQQCKQPVAIPDGCGWKGRGCDRCRGTGYYDRLGLFELLVMEEELRREVLAHRGSDALRSKAEQKGMRLLRREGLRKIGEGVTTLEEVERVTRES